MKHTIITATIISLALFTSCNKKEVKRGEAKYEVEFKGLWDSSIHDNTTTYPSNAHFSPLYGMTHKSDISLFTEGQLASSGIVEMAETGATDILQEELNGLVENGVKQTFKFGGPLSSGTASDKVQFVAGKDESYVSVVTMIAPSPDWFLGVSQFNLKNADGDWIEQITVPMISYDAGSDSGVEFTSANEETSPQGNIALLDNSKFNSTNSSAITLGEVTFTLIEGR